MGVGLARPDYSRLAASRLLAGLVLRSPLTSTDQWGGLQATASVTTVTLTCLDQTVRRR